MELLLGLCRYGIALLFLLAAFSKIWKFNSFCLSLTESFAVPSSFRTPLALTIAGSELSLALWLLFATGSVKFAMALTLVLMLVFSLVLALTYWWRGSVHCNCFGEQHRTFSVADAIRHLIIVSGISLYLYSAEVQLQSLMLWPVLALALALAILLIYLHEATELLTKGSAYD